MSNFTDKSQEIKEPECPYCPNGTVKRDKDFPNEFHCDYCFRKVIIKTYNV